jgi:sensor histidine kinase YesM
MNRAFIILIHFAYWCLYTLLLAGLLLLLLTDRSGFGRGVKLFPFFAVGSVALLPNILSFYLFYGFVFPQLKKRKGFVMVLTALASSAVSAGAATLAVYMISGGNQPLIERASEFVPMALLLTGYAAVHGTVALGIRGFCEWYGELRVKEELIERSHKMELALVRARHDPHFLFNTINNIDVLVGRDPERASDYLQKFSEVLRFALYESNLERVPLENELEYIKKYVELQKIRLSNPDDVLLAVNGLTGPHEIAPMIFIPFIENAFKHRGKGRVSIEFVVGERELDFRCANSTVTGTASDNGAGIGSGLIRRRLELIYPNSHELQFRNRDGMYEVILKIRWE